MTDTDTKTETDALRRLRELKTRLDMARDEGVSGSGFIRALGGHADGFEPCQANDAIELLVPQLKRAIDAWQAERDEDWGAAERLAKAVGVECLSEEDASTVIIRATRAIKARLPTRAQGPVEQALRDEWGKKHHGELGKYHEDINDWCADHAESNRPPIETGCRTGDFFGDLLSELEASAAFSEPRLPEGVAWPIYEDGAPVSIGDRYVNISGDVRTVEWVTVAIGASALCSHGLDDDVYEPGEHVRRPAPADTWGQLRDDATLPPASYCDRHDVNLDQGWEPSDAAQAMALDLIDRAERLAKGGE